MESINITRMDLTSFDIRAWKEGEGSELKKWIGFGFYKTKFVNNNGSTTIYYDKKECEEFDRVLDKKLTEELFNEMCDRFYELIEESENTKTDEDIYGITIKCWPIWTILDALSKYPEWGNGVMLRRLIRVREFTESFSYELSKKVKDGSY